MQKRKIDELITHFNRKVSDMDIEMEYKMELLGMITAFGLIGLACEKEFSVKPEPHWIPCSDCERRCKKWERSKILQE